MSSHENKNEPPEQIKQAFWMLEQLSDKNAHNPALRQQLLFSPFCSLQV